MLTLTQPFIINKEGTTFHVTSAILDFDNKHLQAYWQIKTVDGEALEHGIVNLNDNDFTTWYNEEYTTHESLIKKVALSSGFVGEYSNPELY
jgi:hypothetical protein